MVTSVISSHDLGGRDCAEPVDVPPYEPVFHEGWERKARALVYGVMMHVPNATTSGFRHSIERMEPEHYLTSSYYEHWLTSAASLAVETGLLTQQQLEQRAGGTFPLSRPSADVDISGLGSGAQRFLVGDRVRVSIDASPGHTRCPAYVRGKVGVVTRVDGSFSLPDVEAHSASRVQEGTYSVRFDGLWPEDARSTVNVDLWDSYLEPA